MLVKLRVKEVQQKNGKGEKTGETVWFATGTIEKNPVCFSLQTDSKSRAQQRVDAIANAFANDASSGFWSDLRNFLAPKSFARLYALKTGGKFEAPIASGKVTWSDLVQEYTSMLDRPIERGKKIGKLRRDSTKERYRDTLKPFTQFLLDRNISNLFDITEKLAREVYHDYRVAQIREVKNRKRTDASKLPAGYILECTVLTSIFKFAVEKGMILKNPFRSLGTPGATQEDEGARPFSRTEVDNLLREAGADLLSVIVLFRVGLRREDAVRLKWKNVGKTHIKFTAKKNGRTPRVPISEDLAVALDIARKAHYDNADPDTYADDPVLFNPYTKEPFDTGKKLYERMLRIGVRAGVPDSYPHRFRDTFAKDCFLRGCAVDEVAAYLGDAVETVQKHYGYMDKERMDRADEKMRTNKGLLSVQTAVDRVHNANALTVA